MSQQQHDRLRFSPSLRALQAGRLQPPLALALSVALVGLPAPAQAAQPPAPRLIAAAEAAPEAEQPPRAALRLDTEGLDTSDDALEAKLVEVAAGVFAKQGFSDAIDEQDPRLVVVIERTENPDNPGYVVGFSIEKGDEVVPGSARQLDCSLCTRTELVESIEKELPALLKLALAHQPMRVVDDGGNGENGGDGDGDGDVVGSVDERKIGPLGYAGIGLGVLGVASVGVGVGLAIKGVGPFDDVERYFKDYRTPGIATLSVGGAALIAGVVMIAVDVSKRKKAHSRKQTHVKPHGLGIAF